MCELDYRFCSSKTEAIFNSFVIVPVKLIVIVYQPEKGQWEKKSHICKFYYGLSAKCISLDSELDLWETYWISYRGSLPDNLPNTLKISNFQGFRTLRLL